MALGTKRSAAQPAVLLWGSKMKRPTKSNSVGLDANQLISSDNGALAFDVRRAGGGVHVERIQSLGGIGKLSHIMRFDDVEAFDAAYEADDMKFTYPLVYWRLRHAVEGLLDGQR